MAKKKKDPRVPPINFLRFLIRNRCAYCKEFESESYCDNESTKSRKSLWICLLRPDIAKGHIACIEKDWQACPLRR